MRQFFGNHKFFFVFLFYIKIYKNILITINFFLYIYKYFRMVDYWREREEIFFREIIL